MRTDCAEVAGPDGRNPTWVCPAATPPGWSLSIRWCPLRLGCPELVVLGVTHAGICGPVQQDSVRKMCRCAAAPGLSTLCFSGFAGRSRVSGAGTGKQAFCSSRDTWTRRAGGEPAHCVCPGERLLWGWGPGRVGSGCRPGTRCLDAHAPGCAGRRTGGECLTLVTWVWDPPPRGDLPQTVGVGSCCTNKWQAPPKHSPRGAPRAHAALTPASLPQASPCLSGG